MLSERLKINSQKLHVDTAGCNLQRLELQHGIISQWITIIYFWFKHSNEHDLPVELENKMLGVSHIPLVPVNATGFNAGWHPSVVSWTYPREGTAALSSGRPGKYDLWES